MADETKKDDFDASFDELMKLDDSPPVNITPQAEAPPVETKAEETPPPEEKPDAGPEQQTQPEGEGTPPPVESSGEGEGDEGVDPAEGDKPADEDEELLNRLGALLAKTKVPQAKEPEPASQPEPTPQKEEPLLSADDIKLIEEAEKDWPDVIRAVRTEQMARQKQAIDYVFQEVAKELKPWLATLQAVAQKVHLQDLQTKVPDYDTVQEQVTAWVDKQPKYLQTAYKQVIQHGTADEVSDLISRFKADTGSRPTNTPPAKKKAELPTAAKQAAAALAPVSTKRSQPAGSGIDPSDFDGAFAAFADKV